MPFQSPELWAIYEKYKSDAMTQGVFRPLPFHKWLPEYLRLAEAAIKKVNAMKEVNNG